MDDSYITYTAAKILAETGAVLNVNNEFVEQSSSLLQVLILAALYKITAIPLPLLGLFFSLILGLVCLYSVTRLAFLLRVDKPHFAALLLSLSTAFISWSMGGLEGTLTAFLLINLVLMAYFFLVHGRCKDLALLAIIVALYFLSRPESFFVLIMALSFSSLFFWRVKDGSIAWKRMLLLAAVVCALFAILCVFRYHWYGQIFPQPVYAKAGGISLQKIGFGFLYFLYSAQLSIVVYSATLIIPLISFLKKKKIPVLLVLVVSFVTAQMAFIVASGGDWMVGGRFFVPVMPLLVCITVYYLSELDWRNLYFAVLVLLCCAEIVLFSRFFSNGVPVQQSIAFRENFSESPGWQGYVWSETLNYTHVGDIALLNHLMPVMKAVALQKGSVNFLTIQMGMVPFYIVNQLPDVVYFTDMRGLTTRHLTQCSAFGNFPKNWQGVFIQYDDYFSAQVQGDCNLPKPDVVYDLLLMDEDYNNARLAAMSRYGYQIIYRQSGFISSISGHKKPAADAFIAVNQDVYEQLPAGLKNKEFIFLRN